MKAITICQPYAHLIAIGEKRVENRTWWVRYNGPLAIHAGKNRQWLSPGDDESALVFGAIVATARLVGCVRLDRLERFVTQAPRRYGWLRSHEHVEGPWLWILEGARRLAKPIPYRGERGLFTIPDELIPA